MCFQCATKFKFKSKTNLDMLTMTETGILESGAETGTGL